MCFVAVVMSRLASLEEFRFLHRRDEDGHASRGRGHDRDSEIVPASMKDPRASSIC
ncbi:Hypothetical protein A7982_07319 [Minicystis rosea]|nr:Hypothetical protein A7982_07319 [Minicystis rosea]